MTDLIEVEARLRAVLAEQADAVPAVAGLAAGARRRHRMRRGRRVWTASLVVVLLVPVVLVGLVRMNNHVADDPAGQDDTSGRVVTWNGVSVTVPRSWKAGLPEHWCGTELVQIQNTAPVVATPDTPAPPIDHECNPAHGYGVEVGTDADLAAVVDAAWRAPGAAGPGPRSPRQIAAFGTQRFRAFDRDDAPFPEDSWVRFVATTGGGVLVVTEDRALTDRIAATVHVLDPPAAGWRTVRWPHGRLDVPEDWRVGLPSEWCSHADSPEGWTPRIQLPNDFVFDIPCRPTHGYGAIVAKGALRSIATPGGPAVQDVEPTRGEPTPSYPDGSWVASARVGAWSIVVVAADRRTAEAVAASFRATHAG